MVLGSPTGGQSDFILNVDITVRLTIYHRMVVLGRIHLNNQIKEDVMNTESLADNHYPEILKFCNWLQKEHEERGLQYVKLSLKGPSVDMKISLPNSPPPDPKNFENWFGRSAMFTPKMAVALRGYVVSCAKTEAFDYFENVCTEFNCIEELVAKGETKQLPGLI